MKVLVADDARSSLQLISAYIEEAGHQAVTAADGMAAVEQFKRERPDLVLLDVEMPRLNGIEAARKICRLCEQQHDWVPIVFLSSLSQSKHIVEGIEAGGDDYLTKPVDPTVLNAKLKAMQRIADMRARLETVNRQLKEMAENDGLTGIANRRRFNNVLIREFRRAARNQNHLSMLLLDIDHFKSFNDTHGHQTGDDCLRAVAQTMSDSVRRGGDMVARYGGEEFAVILPETDLPSAMIVAENIRSNVAEMNVDVGHSILSVTVSCGAASIAPSSSECLDQHINNLIERADQGLYQAKEKGRNRVHCIE
ncbi:MAG: diguanylate cyclase response regulator [Gammaproteobacteria bacterium]|nr:MAG: diguanylate cyclase response regulator [Gammaproteobacteria bacterium]